MGFFARPDLTDIQFKQIKGGELTLSGTTRIATTTGLTLIGDGGYIPIVATGETNGYVMTYNSTKGVIELAESTLSGGTLPFTQGLNTITRFAQDTQYNVNVSATTVNDFLEGFFFPSVPPTSSLSVLTTYSGGSSSSSVRQFGDMSYGCLCWGVTCNTYPLCAISASTNGTGSYNCQIYSGTGVGTTGSCVTYTYSSICAAPTYPASSACTNTSVTFCLHGTSCTNETTSTSSAISWRNKRYDFKNATLYDDTDASTIRGIANALPSSSSNGSTAVLMTSKTMCCTIALSNEFFYYMYPKILGTPTFVINGLPNNAWGNESVGTLFDITFCNNNNYNNEYYVARSDSRITGTYVISVT